MKNNGLWCKPEISGLFVTQIMATIRNIPEMPMWCPCSGVVSVYATFPQEGFRASSRPGSIFLNYESQIEN